MESKVFTMASAKGGSGKTLLTASFASFLSELGKKVLIIDSDSTTNGLTLMYLKEVLIEKEIIHSNGITPTGLFDFKNDPENKKINIVQLNNNVSLIPATFSFEHLNDSFREMHKNFVSDRLHLIIKNSRTIYDYIFIDAQAGSDRFAEVAINKNISDEVIIVSEYDPLSAAGVERLKGIFRDDLTYNRTWYLLNKMIPEFIQSFSDFLEIAKYLNPIPWDADVVRSYARRKLPLDVENGNEFTVAIIQTLRTLLGDDMAVEIDNWKMKKESFFKEPLDKQYIFLQSRLEKIEIKEQRTKYLNSIIMISCTTGFILMLIISYFFFSKSESIYFKIILGILGVLGVFIIPRFLTAKSDYSSDIERDVIVEQLKRLEGLKYSNFDTIVRDRRENLSSINNQNIISAKTAKTAYNRR